MLRLLSLEMRVRVRENEYPVMAVDHSFPTSRVTRQARVTCGVDLARANSVADFEAGFGISIRTRVTRPLCSRRRYIGNREWRLCLL